MSRNDFDNMNSPDVDDCDRNNRFDTPDNMKTSAGYTTQTSDYTRNAPDFSGTPTGAGTPTGPGLPTGPIFPTAETAQTAPNGNYKYSNNPYKINGTAVNPTNFLPKEYDQINKSYVSKSKILAGSFGILFGAIGLHNFYLGYTKKAMIQLFITVFMGGMFCLIPIIWGFIEGIYILTGKNATDKQGHYLK